MDIVLQRGAGPCDVTATGVGHLVQIILLLLLLGMLGEIKAGIKGRWEETLCLDPAMCRPRFGSLMWCLLVDHLVQGVGTPPAATDSPVANGDLLGALKLLQTVMSAEDFSKYEKMVVPPSKEERTKHVEQIAKLEADAAKQRTMLQGAGTA